MCTKYTNMHHRFSIKYSILPKDINIINYHNGNYE